MAAGPWAAAGAADPPTATRAKFRVKTKAPAQTEFPCGSCGAKLRFKPGTETITCDHCGHQNPIPKSEVQVEENDLLSALNSVAEEQPTEEKRTVKCSACAAEFTFDANVHSSECPFCASPIVTETKSVRTIQPVGVLPFVLDHKQGHEALTKWLGKLWFAPNDVVKYARTEGKLTGMYVPYWTYDSQTYTDYTGYRGDAYYVTVTDRDGKTSQRREIRWTPVSGHLERFFDDVLVVASQSLPKKYADRLQSWRLEDVQPYSVNYLAGFRSEVYQVGLEQGFNEARQRMEAMIYSDVRADIGGDEQRVSSVDTDFRDLTFKHILLPIWLAAYKYRGKSYQFLVNGQTGEVQGERPYSWIKITLAVLAGLVVLGVVIWLLGKGR
jgi:DNA-directed RNA polymerase subunit RPC12/RpoP